MNVSMGYKTINDIPEKIFIKSIDSSLNRTDFFRKMKMSPFGGKFRTLNKRIQRLNLNIDHFKLGPIISGEKSKMTKDKALSTIFINNSNIKTPSLKKYIQKFEFKKYVCENCCNQGQWMNSNLVLQLHHIDGDARNNKLNNLQFLCPNCHSQTPNFSGKKRKESFYCLSCKKELSRKTKTNLCFKCAHREKQQKTKIVWPSNSKLELLLSTHSCFSIAKKLGVSDNAIRKHCKKHKIWKFK